MVVKWNTRRIICWQPYVAPLNGFSTSVFSWKLWVTSKFKAGPEGNNHKDSDSTSDKVKLRAATLTWMNTTQYESYLARKKSFAYIHTVTWMELCSLCNPTDMQLISDYGLYMHLSMMDAFTATQHRARMPECLLCEPSWFEPSHFQSVSTASWLYLNLSQPQRAISFILPVMCFLNTRRHIYNMSILIGFILYTHHTSFTHASALEDDERGWANKTHILHKRPAVLGCYLPIIQEQRPGLSDHIQLDPKLAALMSELCWLSLLLSAVHSEGTGGF